MTFNALLASLMWTFSSNVHAAAQWVPHEHKEQKKLSNTVHYSPKEHKLGPRIIRAVNNGDCVLAHELLARGAPVNYPDSREGMMAVQFLNGKAQGWDLQYTTSSIIKRPKGTPLGAYVLEFISMPEPFVVDASRVEFLSQHQEEVTKTGTIANQKYRHLMLSKSTGFTPLDWAARQNNRPLVDLICDHRQEYIMSLSADSIEAIFTALRGGLFNKMATYIRQGIILKLIKEDFFDPTSIIMSQKRIRSICSAQLVTQMSEVFKARRARLKEWKVMIAPHYKEVAQANQELLNLDWFTITLSKILPTVVVSIIGEYRGVKVPAKKGAKKSPIVGVVHITVVEGK